MESIEDLVARIMDKENELNDEMAKAISGEKGAKAAAKRARKASSELDKLLLQFRKDSVRLIG